MDIFFRKNSARRFFRVHTKVPQLSQTMLSRHAGHPWTTLSWGELPERTSPEKVIGRWKLPQRWYYCCRCFQGILLQDISTPSSMVSSWSQRTALAQSASGDHIQKRFQKVQVAFERCSLEEQFLRHIFVKSSKHPRCLWRTLSLQTVLPEDRHPERPYTDATRLWRIISLQTILGDPSPANIWTKPSKDFPKLVSKDCTAGSTRPLFEAPLAAASRRRSRGAEQPESTLQGQELSWSVLPKAL